MNDIFSEQKIILSEAMKIEIMKRWDAARSLYPLAVMLYVRTDKASKEINELKNRMYSRWLWVPLIILSIISYVISIDDGWQWNWANKLLAFCGFLFIGWSLESIVKERKLNDAYDKLRNVEMIWKSNVVYSDLSEIKKFIDEDYLDPHTDDFYDWQKLQRLHIEKHISGSL